MKELQENKIDKIEIANYQQATSFQKIGSLLRYPGQTVFEMDLNTGKIAPAEFKEVRAHLDNSIHWILHMKSGCIYCCAINESNAARKFIKMAIGK